MKTKIQAIRGMNDILPDKINYWQHLEVEIQRLCDAYGYEEIRMPIVEVTNLFQRSIGEVTDIVEKEMYTFLDRNGESLTLRPEATASCVRAVLQHGLINQQPQRLWYYGPMYRYERPQRGRYRQFYQLGLEAFGFEGPDIDLELICFTDALWRKIGIRDKVVLQLNSLGTASSRGEHRKLLVEYFRKHFDQLDADSKRRLDTNPLRILDSKNPEMQELNNKATKMLDHLDEDSKKHFAQLCAWLDKLEIPYEINTRLVRGLDYYSKTVFEWVTEELGAQGTVCGGGRYDALVEELGGQPTPAIGFCMGVERVLELMTKQIAAHEVTRPPHAYMVLVGEQAAGAGFALAQRLRAKLPALRLCVNMSGGPFKKQFMRADKSNAEYALILGDDEVSRGEIGVKFLRKEEAQQTLTEESLITFLQTRLSA